VKRNLGLIVPAPRISLTLHLRYALFGAGQFNDTWFGHIYGRQ
jgi:hypothetical protein